MNKLIKQIEEMAGKYNKGDIFKDFVLMTAVSISNRFEFDEDKEREYESIAKKYSKDELENFSSLVGMLVLGMESNPGDILGEIFMKLKIGNKKDQYFTPMNVARMMGEITDSDDEKEFINVNDPSCGSGAMVIAKALNMYDKGINYQNNMRAVVQDLDRTVLLMCYVQLSFLGIDATCSVGDSLKPNEVSEVWYTPMNYMNRQRGFLKSA